MSLIPLQKLLLLYSARTLRGVPQPILREDSDRQMVERPNSLAAGKPPTLSAIASILKVINQDHLIKKVKGVLMTTETNLQVDIRDGIEQFKEEGTFQWTKQWYPVAVVEFTRPISPPCHAVTGKGYGFVAGWFRQMALL
jgi:hypothetical protein